MNDPETEAEVTALITIRRQLTVALLAVEHLCRTGGAFPAVSRLCGIAKDALLRIRDEVVGLEERFMHRGRHASAPSDTVEGHPPDS